MNRQPQQFTLCKLALLSLFAVAESGQAVAEPVNPFAKPPLIAMDAAQPAKTASNGDLILRGVLLADNDSLANISGTLYGIEENVAGMQVTEIGEDFVTLKGGDSQLRLTLADTQQPKRTR
ncbi:MAG: hypothetical protein NXH85_07335 [Pseudomonadaceae bacterium]|nr:hypothetical protein [Pseudomonadaceae bacterium]